MGGWVDLGPGRPRGEENRRIPNRTGNIRLLVFGIGRYVGGWVDEGEEDGWNELLDSMYGLKRGRKATHPSTHHPPTHLPKESPMIPPPRGASKKLSEARMIPCWSRWVGGWVGD